MITATPITWSAHRAIHRGSRFGQCSKIPNASMAIRPSGTVRIGPTSHPSSQWRLSSSPMGIERARVKATRRQPRIEAGSRRVVGVLVIGGIVGLYLTRADHPTVEPAVGCARYSFE